MSAQWLRPYGQNCDNDHNVVHLKDKTCFAMFHWHEKEKRSEKKKPDSAIWKYLNAPI